MASCLTHGVVRVQISQEALDTTLEAIKIGGHITCDARLDQEFWPPLRGDDSGHTGGHRLEDDVPKSVRCGGKDKQIHVRVSLSQLLPAEDSGEVGVGHVGLKPWLLIALADDDEFKVLPARLEQRRADVGQKADILFRCETSDIANSENP